MPGRFSVPKKNIIIDNLTKQRMHIKGGAFQSLFSELKGDPDLKAAIKEAADSPATRMAGDKLQQTPMTTTSRKTPQPIRRQDNRAYTNEDVTRSEARAIDLIRSELNPRAVNQRNYGIDLQTDIGPIDVQYNKTGDPFLDLISWGHLKGHQGRLAPFSEAQSIHRMINQDIYDGANLQDVMQRLNTLGVTIGKPGKLLNTDAYPAVAFLAKQGDTFSNPTAIDMAGLRQALTDNPMKDLGAKVYFNDKLKYARSRNDNFESAMVSLENPAILRDFNITNRFF